LRYPAADRQRIDQHTALLLLEVRQYHMGTAQIAEKIGLHHLFMGIQWRLVERADCADAGIVDPHIDAPLAELRRSAGQCFDLIAVGDVGGHHQYFAAERAAFIGGFRKRLDVACGKHQS